MTLDSILKDDINRANKAKQEKNKSENQIVAKEFEQQMQPNNNKQSSVASEIKLKSACLLATKSVCYALLCKEALFSFEDVPSSLPPVVTNILQEFADVFPQDVPPGLPPIQGIEHQIDLIPGGTSCGKTSANSCKMLVTAGGKEEGTSSNENNTSLHTKA